MFLIDRRNVLQTTFAAACALAAPSWACASTARSEVFTADKSGFLVDSTIIVGEKSAVVIDAQFDVRNATALAGAIQATGRSLESVFITHFHPDHLMGLPVLLDRFPAAKAYAHSDVHAQISKIGQGMWNRVRSKRPTGVISDRFVVPDALKADHLMLEGERLEILPPMLGDTPLITPVHIPALDTVVASDVAMIDSHLWMEETGSAESVAAWRKSVAQLKAIGASTIIPGHRKEASANTPAVFEATLKYLDHWETSVAATNNAADLKAALLKGHENHALAFSLDRSIAALYPKK